MRPPRSLARAIFCGIFSLPIEILPSGAYMYNPSRTRTLYTVSPVLFEALAKTPV